MRCLKCTGDVIQQINASAQAQRKAGVAWQHHSEGVCDTEHDTQTHTQR